VYITYIIHCIQYTKQTAYIIYTTQTACYQCAPLLYKQQQNLNTHEVEWNCRNEGNTPEVPGNNHSQSRTNLRSQTMSTQKITSSDGKR